MTASFDTLGTTSLEIIDISPITDNISIFNASFQNFHKICRFCLGSDNLKPFFDMTYNQASVQSIIYDCTSLQVDPEDNLPYNLCETCITELIRVYKFKQRCIQVTSILQDSYDNGNLTSGNEKSIESNNFICSGGNEVDLIIKNEVIEDSLSIRNDCIFGDMNSDDLVIKNEGIQNVATICEDNILQDINCDNLIIKNKEVEDAVNIHNDRVLGVCNEDYAADDNNLKCGKILHIEELTSCSNTKVISLHNCIVCKTSFSEKSDLTRHMLFHTGDRPHKCNICEKSFVRSCDLKKHMLSHKGERPHKCSTCEKSFITKSNLNRHTSIHKGERLHKCSICMKSFSQKSGRDLHLLVHTGERPHNCEVCKKSFTQKSTLKLHMSTHTGEGPHKCSVCRKFFSKKSGLDLHMSVNTGERPHKCPPEVFQSEMYTQRTHEDSQRCKAI